MKNVFRLIGALTSKPYAFKARSWELRSFDSIDVFDALGANIQVELRGNSLLRVLPRFNDGINEHWLSDKSRFAYDSVTLQRVGYPLKGFSVFLNKSKKLSKFFKEMDLLNLFKLLRFDFKFGLFCKKFANWSVNFFGIIGPLVSSESIFLLKKILNKLGSSNLIYENYLNLWNRFDIGLRKSYVFNLRVLDIDKVDTFLLVGTNPRLESPVLNLRIRKQVLRGASVFSFGSVFNSIYGVVQLGNSTASLIVFVEGRHKFCTRFLKASRPFILLGPGILEREDSVSVIYLFNKFCDFLNNLEVSFNLLHLYSNSVSVFDLGYVPGVHSNLFNYKINSFSSYNVIFSLGISKFFNKTFFNQEYIQSDSLITKPTVVYQGSHGFSSLSNLDFIIPSTMLIESGGLLTNLEGRVQEVLGVLTPAKGILSSHTLLSMFITLFKRRYNYLKRPKIRQLFVERLDDLYVLMSEICPRYNREFINFNSIGFSNFYKHFYYWSFFSVNKCLFNFSVDNFYLSDELSRNSKLMAQCSKYLLTECNENFNKKKI